MIDHITIRVKNIDTVVAFYSEALKPLGNSLDFDKNFDSVRVVGFRKNGKIDLWFTDDTPLSGSLHIALRAESKEEVDRFYEAGIRAGGKDNGAPGIRPEYHEKYYGAFLLDPEGNNIEAVFGN